MIPEGYTFASASGVLLSAPVPEPESYALLATGLALVGWRMRRRVAGAPLA